MNPKEIITENIGALVDKIDVKNTTLWERLVELRTFQYLDVEYIKVSGKVTLKLLELILLLTLKLSMDWQFL